MNDTEAQIDNMADNYAETATFYRQHAHKYPKGSRHREANLAEAAKYDRLAARFRKPADDE